jgi:hypothetical protein
MNPERIQIIQPKVGAWRLPWDQAQIHSTLKALNRIVAMRVACVPIQRFQRWIYVNPPPSVGATRQRWAE